MNTPLNLRIEHLHTYAGPSIYADEPVIVARLSIPPHLLLDASTRIRQMHEACCAWLDAPPVPDELTAVMVGQHLVTWALSALNEVRGILRVARAEADSEGALLILGYHEPRISLGALGLAGSLFSGTHQNTTAAALALEDLWRACKQRHPDYQSAILMTAARTLGTPFLPFSQRGLYQYGWGARGRVFLESSSTADSMIGAEVATNKASSKAFFRSMGVPTPLHVSINSASELEQAISIVGYPCVIKPLKGSKGTAVTVCIDNLERARLAFDAAHQANAGPVMIERFVQGDDHRLLVIGGKFIAAIRREPPEVVGNGRQTIRELVAELNTPRSSNLVKSRYLRPVPIDDVVLECLRAQRLTPDFVPAPEQRVRLRTNANLSTGGTCVDVTQQVHPSLKTMAEHLAASIGLPTAGLDYVTSDISQSPWHSGGAFIEANSIPGIDVAITAGVSVEHLGRLTLGDGVDRIPVSLIISESPPQSEHFTSPTTPCPARVIGNAVRIGDSEYRVSSTAPWAAVQAALCNRAVQALEIFSAPAQIIAHGLPVDRLDRTVLIDTHLPDQWRSVIERCSRTTETRPSFRRH